GNDPHPPNTRREKPIDILQRKPCVFQPTTGTLGHDLVLGLMGRPAQWMLVYPYNSSFSFDTHNISLRPKMREWRRRLLAASRLAASAQLAVPPPTSRRQYDHVAVHSAPPVFSDRLVQQAPTWVCGSRRASRLSQLAGTQPSRNNARAD